MENIEDKYWSTIMLDSCLKPYLLSETYINLRERKLVKLSLLLMMLKKKILAGTFQNSDFIDRNNY